MTERQRRPLYPNLVSPATLEVARAFQAGWRPSLLTQIEPILDASRVSPLPSVFGGFDLLRQVKTTARAVAQHLRTPLVTPQIAQAILNIAAPPLVYVGMLVQSPVWVAICNQTTETLRG